MTPTRIMFIRHAEKPDKGISQGVTGSGSNDSGSITPRGWQRAGALVRYFCPLKEPAPEDSMKPRAIFAAAVDDGDPSERSQETVTPLFEYLKTEGPVDFVTTHQKTDHQGLIDDLLQHNGIVLVAWEHKQIPALIACLPDAPVTPTEWPDSRLDVTLVLDQNAGGWRFSQVPQLLLAGDSPAPIE